MFDVSVDLHVYPPHVSGSLLTGDVDLFCSTEHVLPGSDSFISMGLTNDSLLGGVMAYPRRHPNCRLQSQDGYMCRGLGATKRHDMPERHTIFWLRVYWVCVIDRQIFFSICYAIALEGG
jgi:hypothetical protein